MCDPSKAKSQTHLYLYAEDTSSEKGASIFSLIGSPAQAVVSLSLSHELKQCFTKVSLLVILHATSSKYFAHLNDWLHFCGEHLTGDELFHTIAA